MEQIPKELDDNIDVFDEMVHHFKILCSEFELYLDKIRQVRHVIPTDADSGMYKAMNDMRGSMQKINHLSCTVKDINGLVACKKSISDQLEDMMKMYNFQKDIAVPEMITSKMNSRIIKKSILIKDICRQNKEHDGKE